MLCALPLFFNSGFLARNFIHLEDGLSWSFSALVECDNVFRCPCIWCTILVSVERNESLLWSVCSNAVAGESALDRMACGLGGKLVLPMIKEHIMQMLQNRKPGLPQMLEGCSVTF